jgi:hypothetical protein
MLYVNYVEKLVSGNFVNCVDFYYILLYFVVYFLYFVIYFLYHFSIFFHLENIAKYYSLDVENIYFTNIKHSKTSYKKTMPDLLVKYIL